MKMKIFSPVPTSERFEFEDEDELPHQQSLFNERVRFLSILSSIVMHDPINNCHVGWASKTGGIGNKENEIGRVVEH